MDYSKITCQREISHRAGMSGKFDSRKDSHSTKFEKRPQTLVKLTFRQLCDSKLSVSVISYVLLIIWPFHCVKNRLKTENLVVGS